MDPLYIEDGPSWFWAAVSAIWTTALLAGAMEAQQAQSVKLAVCLGGLAFGSAIGRCFSTRFKARKSDVSSWILRWWMAKIDGWGDGFFKLVFVIPLRRLPGVFGVPNS